MPFSDFLETFFLTFMAERTTMKCRKESMLYRHTVKNKYEE